MFSLGIRFAPLRSRCLRAPNLAARMPHPFLFTRQSSMALMGMYALPVRGFASAFGQNFDPKKDYWKVLNVKPGSSEKEVKVAYYKMAQKFHPDKTGGKTEAKFKEIQAAYEVLSDSGTRAQWEAARSGYSGYDDFGGQRSNWNQRYN